MNVKILLLTPTLQDFIDVVFEGVELLEVPVNTVTTTVSLPVLVFVDDWDFFSFQLVQGWDGILDPGNHWLEGPLELDGDVLFEIIMKNIEKKSKSGVFLS